ncbi:hypothetical protein V3592_45965, partial [Bradyrhizobium japonicum]
FEPVGMQCLLRGDATDQDDVPDAVHQFVPTRQRERTSGRVGGDIKLVEPESLGQRHDITGPVKDVAARQRI